MNNPYKILYFDIPLDYQNHENAIPNSVNRQKCFRIKDHTAKQNNHSPPRPPSITYPTSFLKTKPKTQTMTTANPTLTPNQSKKPIPNQNYFLKARNKHIQDQIPNTKPTTSANKTSRSSTARPWRALTSPYHGPSSTHRTSPTSLVSSWIL